MIPTQSAMRAYDTSRLTEHATHWRDLAARRRSVVGTVTAQANSLNWVGQGDEAMTAAMRRHLSTAEEEVGLLDSAAVTAEGGASVLHQQQQSILSGVDQARQSGFAVGEDWSVTDTMYTPGSMGWYARQPTAQTISADLRTQATTFAGQELQTATDVTSAARDLGGEGAVRGHIQAVGHGFKTDGGDSEFSGPPPDQPTDLGGLLGAPPDNSFVNQYQQAITAPPAPHSAAPPPMPASPPPRPPQMGPAPPPVPSPDAPPEANPTVGGFLGTAVPGCLAGAGDGGLLTALFPPLEVLGVPGGCIAGGIVAGGGYLGGVWVDNMLNGNG